MIYRKILTKCEPLLYHTPILRNIDFLVKKKDTFWLESVCRVEVKNAFFSQTIDSLKILQTFEHWRKLRGWDCVRSQVPADRIFETFRAEAFPDSTVRKQRKPNLFLASKIRIHLYASSMWKPIFMRQIARNRIKVATDGHFLTLYATFGTICRSF